MKIGETKNYYTVLLIVLLLLFGITDAPSETTKTMKWKEVGYAKNIQLTDVPDFKGHIVGMFERRGLNIFLKMEPSQYISRWVQWTVGTQAQPVRDILNYHLKMAQQSSANFRDQKIRNRESCLC